MNKNIIAAIIMLLLTLDSGYFVDRNNFTHLIAVYSALFALYFYILKTTKSNQEYDFWYKMAFILRGVLLFSIPNFSEDIYRFIWDGRLINSGINPFDFKPSYYFQNHILPDILTSDLYNQLNSKEYFTVYPPVCQGVFAFAAWVFPNSIAGSCLIIKAFLLASEIGTLILLKKLLPKAQKVLIYALNPLIIIELCNNAHFEAAMIFFLILSIFLLKKATNTEGEGIKIETLIKSAGAFALSISSKMLSLMFLPIFIKRIGIKKSIIYFTAIGIYLLVFFLPLFNALFFTNLQTSLNLYFTKFEFNASLYYIIREIGTSLRGYNPINEISPILKVITLIIFTFLFISDWLKTKQGDFINESGGVFKIALFILSIYFICATTVHPWYAALPLALSVFTHYRYIVVWTSLIPLTYIHYSYPLPTENYWIISFEYVVVIGYFIYENTQLTQIKNRQPHNSD